MNDGFGARDHIPLIFDLLAPATPILPIWGFVARALLILLERAGSLEVHEFELGAYYRVG